MKTNLLSLAIATGLLATASVAQATPISYEGALSNGVTVTGSVTETGINGATDPGADWWYFRGTAGSTVTLTGHRLASGLDPAFYIYFGMGDTSALSLVASGDDNIAELPGLDGPWADPQATFTLGASGFYSVSMWPFASSSNGEYPYSLVATGVDAVPEPGSLALLGLGLFGLAAGRRRKA